MQDKTDKRRFTSQSASINLLEPIHDSPSLRLEPFQDQYRIVPSEDRNLPIKDVWKAVPSGPVPELCEDFGFWPGKSEALESNNSNKRWGSWNHNLFDLAKEYHSSNSSFKLSRYLPRQLNELKPTRVFMDPLKKEVDMDASTDLNELEADESALAIDPELWGPFEEEGNIGESEMTGSTTQIEPLNVSIGIPTNDKQQKQTNVSIDLFKAIDLSDYIPAKSGFMFNAGSSVWGMSWCPIGDLDKAPASTYLAVSAISCNRRMQQTALDETKKRNLKPGLLQIWESTVPNDKKKLPLPPTKLEFVLGICTDIGEATQLKWCPRGGNSLKSQEDKFIGILAGSFFDGSVSLFAVPNPKSTTVKHCYQRTERNDESYIYSKEPLLKLSVDNTNIWCFDWASHDTLVAGCTNGYIAVFHIQDALEKGQRQLGPSNYFSLHSASIQSLSIIRLPGSELNDSKEPSIVVSSGIDGSSFLFDLRDLDTRILLAHDRAIRTATCYCPQYGGFIVSDGQYSIDFSLLQSGSVWQRNQIVQCRGTVWSISSSDVHPFYSIGSGDGACTISTLVPTNQFKRSLSGPTFTLYQLDFNRKTGELRILDNLLPQPQEEKTQPLFGVFPNQIGVQVTTWSQSLRSPCLLASGTGCGICRVDWVEGRNLAQGDLLDDDDDEDDFEDD